MLQLESRLLASSLIMLDISFAVTSLTAVLWPVSRSRAHGPPMTRMTTLCWEVSCCYTRQLGSVCAVMSPTLLGRALQCMPAMSEFVGGKRGGAMRPWLRLAPLLLLLLLCLPAPARTMDLAAIMTAFTRFQPLRPCPAPCQCSTRRAQDVMQDYLSRYLLSMAPHMQPQLEPELRSKVALMTSWLGNVADIQCHVQRGDHVNLTHLLQTSALSFKSVQVTCQATGFVVWDVAPGDAFLSVLHLTGCGLERGARQHSIVLPPNLWVLDLQRVPAEVIDSLDFSQASQLRTFSFSHTNLSSLPRRWSQSVLPNLLFVNLAYNNLKSYDCELNTSELKSIILDYNKLEAVPQCFLKGSRYSSHVSLRHNQVQNLQELSVHPSGNVSSNMPQFTYLDLAHNQLDNLRLLKKVKGLLGLDLSHNHLESMASDCFSLNPQLLWLDLSSNFLDHVADSMLGSLKNVKSLNLSHNSLQSFDSDHDIPRSEKLFVDLRHNHLIYPPFAGLAYTVPRQVQIHAGHNPYLCDCNIHAFLQQYKAVGKEKQKHWLDFSSLYSFRDPTPSHAPFQDMQDFTCARPAELKNLALTSLNFQKVCPLPRGCPKDCRCKLVKEGVPRVSVDCSAAAAMSELPDNLPFIPDTALVLYLNQTSLRRLDHRPYLHRVRELYASNSKLSSVTPEALASLENISVLDLHHAQLRSLPALMGNLTLPEISNISLSGNPWACACRDLWMPDWLARHASVVHDADKIRCHWTGKPVSDLDPLDLSCGLMDYLPITIAVSLLAGLTIIVLSFVAKYKLEILVVVYRYTSLRPWDMFRYSDAKPVLFDVFVSFSEMDYHWVVEKLMEHLENQAKPYRLCTHLRDFPMGASFADSVAWAVDNSRCTLLVMSRDLITNEWGRPSIRAAHQRLFRESPGKVLVVIHGPLDARSLDRETLDFLRTTVYLKSEDSWFWTKLDYALPRRQELGLLMPEPSMLEDMEESSTVTEIGSYLSGGLASGDISHRKGYESSASAGP